MHIFFAVLRWHSSISINDLYGHKYISLPGIFNYMDISTKENFTKRDILTVSFMSDNYKENENTFHLQPNNCSNILNFNIACLTYSNNRNDEYIVIINTKTFMTGRSWNDSDKLCKEIGGYLPQFESKEKLKAFLAFMKSEDIAGLEAFYIGLKTKVKIIWFYVFFIHLCKFIYLVGCRRSSSDFILSRNWRW